MLPYILPLPSLRVTQVEERLRGLTPDMHWFVAEVNGETVGYAGMQRYVGRLGHAGSIFLAVRPADQGQGMGPPFSRRCLTSPTAGSCWSASS